MAVVDVRVKMFLFFIFRLGTRSPYILGRNEKNMEKQRNQQEKYKQTQ